MAIQDAGAGDAAVGILFGTAETQRRRDAEFIKIV